MTEKTEEAQIPDKEELLALADGEASEVEEQAEAEYTEVEMQAIEMGWNPEGVEGKRNLSAEEYVDRKELYDTIHSLKRQNKRLEEGFEALKQHNTHIAEKTRAKVIEELKSQKKLALEEGDYDGVLRIDEQIEEAKKEETAPVSVSNPVFDAWIEKNSWYEEDESMKEYADMIGIGYHARYPNKPMEDVYAHVSKEVKARFSDKFSNPKAEKSSPVEGASRSRTKPKSKYSAKDLPDEARMIMKTLIRDGVITEEKYLEEYFG